MKYDLAVIGAGPGGYTAALKAVSLGLSVALIEKEQTGGTCLNRGCIPTKALLHTAQLYKNMKNAYNLGIITQGLSYDAVKMHERADSVVFNIRTNLEALLKRAGIHCIKGNARIKSEGLVVINDTDTLECSYILIASGSKVSIPRAEGIEDCAFTSDDILTGKADVPADFNDVVIVGGGVIGCEMAEIYSSLCKKVTILEFQNRILSTQDREISQTLSASFRKRGIDVITGAALTRCRKENGRIICDYVSGDSMHSVECDLLISAAGRRANTDGIFEPGFIETVGSAIVTDASHRTSRSGIYAVGDAVHGAVQLAHYAAACGKNTACIIAGIPPVIDESVVPCCIYTDPEIACVGMSKDEAAEKEIAVNVKKYPISANGKASIETDERGFVKLITDSNGIIKGAQLVCPRASDMISELAVAISRKMHFSDIAGVIHPHPTVAESIADTAELFF